MLKFFNRAKLAMLALGLTLVMLPAAAVVAQDKTTEALGVPGPIQFAGGSYALSWTSHPSASYYKQEYLPDGQTSERYLSMFMLDVTTTGQTVENAVSAHISALEGRKSSDPMVNYNSIQNKQTGEVILDCILSDTSGPEAVVEWDAYRYTPLGDGIAVFAISQRAYGNDIEPFLANQVDARQVSIGELAKLELPKVAPQ
ncbi:hypothetical protein [Devosia sp.]|uniref:hypothetical protein n=1 Tax=Devosia sp. TaxID=1871048 RepID=UPI003262E604